MDHLVLQNEPNPPDREIVKRSLLRVKRLTEADAIRLAKDAYGVLARNLSREEAFLVQNALQESGVPAQALPASQFPKLPDPRYIKRLDIQPAALAVYDPLGRPVPIPWAQVLLVSAGMVRHFGTTQTTTEEWVHHYNVVTGSSYRLETDVRHKVEDNTRAFMEIVLAGAVMRFEIEAENFLFPPAYNRPGVGVGEKLGLLVSSLVQQAPHLCLNRGATALCAQAPVPLIYPSKQALSEESAWWLWRLSIGNNRS